ncbi:hypothetical protein CXG81DRAFT_14449 [Caulochytrium protostelioides]|uniref:Methionine aminopeptidase 2 n=1 Tax=Caulochytrium protostelioides TaxID=1555241 RepID=A0A4P9WUX9_9FUNG|nr:hypothetical protein CAUPRSCDRAFT_9536 [Caulochytrium protostelioides]RKO99482.1 hypothetical protein CXG81DRAFT_14449 [Caulochytrium protostelioides]|eukprot:RKO99482.1 hypothetical protein CXG81DRAFT_14449 [Caulochytrium protostelioides]
MGKKPQGKGAAKKGGAANGSAAQAPKKADDWEALLDAAIEQKAAQVAPAATASAHGSAASAAADSDLRPTVASLAIKPLSQDPVPAEPKTQTEPPSVPLDHIFLGGKFPEGRIVEYAQVENAFRTTDEEVRARDRAMGTRIQDLRKAGEIHRQVRAYARKVAQPGVKLIDVANTIENSVRRLTRHTDLKGGIAFPTGLSLNHCAAHWTPMPGDVKTTLGKDDVLKIDFGVQVNGAIIDSAFTVHHNPQYDNLVQGVKAATDAGIREAGIDARFDEIGAAIQEVMESYEVELKGRTYGVKPIRNLCGHSIEPYRIHGSKSVPIVKGGDQTRMEEGELYAIETFGSTGKGWVSEGPENSHFMRNWELRGQPAIRLERSQQLLKTIEKRFGTLAFCQRYLEYYSETRYQNALRNLVDLGVLTAHPPLVDIPGSYTAQFENTILLRPTCKEIMSGGDDY